MRYLPLAALAALLPACGSDSPSDPIDASTPADAEVVVEVDAVPPDAMVDAVFRNPLPELSDAEVSLAALQILGAEVEGATGSCDGCHGMSRAQLHGWGDLSTASMSSCLTDLEVDDAAAAAAIIACLREDPEDASSPFSPSRLGLYSTAAHLGWFRQLFRIADPDAGDELHAEFLARVGMPRGGHPRLDQAQFDVIAEWAVRGTPLIDELIPQAPPGVCTPSITGEVADHVATMALEGWRAVNAERGINMHGCAGATSPRECLSDYPEAAGLIFAQTWNDDLPGQQLRLLKTLNYTSSFWTRSSADGRFVAHGGGASASSTIVDLGTPGRMIGTTAFYDPGFFPDNSGFAFQGGGAHVCDQRVLTATPPDNFINYGEPGCAPASSAALYQHMGAALEGDYWIVNSQWVGDNGGWGGANGDPFPGFSSDAQVSLLPLVHDGTTYQERTVVGATTPFEGDIVLSPSATLLLSRVNGGSEQAGYRLRRLIATPVGDTYTIQIPVIATYCVDGAKPAISYDERWMVTHHYIANTDEDAIDLGFASAADPGFQAYAAQGAANVVLVDLLTGDRTRVTRMAPGQFALFPHFRSDGWIYFEVRAGGAEYIVASDAALLGHP